MTISYVSKNISVRLGLVIFGEHLASSAGLYSRERYGTRRCRPFKTYMKILNFAAMSLTCALLTACLAPITIPQPEPLLTDPVRVAARTQIKRDEYKKMTNFTGANAVKYGTLFIRAWRDDKTNKTDFQIYADSYYSGGWRFYQEAYDSDGNRMDFVSIDRKVVSCRGGCSYEETVGMSVTRKYLEDHQDTGIRFKVSGKAGEFTGELPAAYVKGLLMSVDAAG